MKNILILGIGNILRKDDGAGVRAARYLMESDVPPDIEVFDGGCLGYDLLAVMANRRRIIIIDALKIDAEPGSIYRFPTEILRRYDAPSLIPAFNLHTLIAQLNIAGYCPEIEIIGIVPKDYISFDMELSQEVGQAIPRAAQEALAAAIK